MQIKLKNKLGTAVNGVTACIKPCSANIYPYKHPEYEFSECNGFGPKDYGDFNARQEKDNIESDNKLFCFDISSTDPLADEMIVFDLFSLDGADNVSRERVCIPITGKYTFPPKLDKKSTRITPLNGIKPGTEINIGTFINEPGPLHEVKAIFLSSDERVQRSIILTDPDGDNFFEGSWIVDHEGFYSVYIKATDIHGNSNQLA